MKKTFSIKTLFNGAWADYKKTWKLFILIGIIFMLVGLASNLAIGIDPYTGLPQGSPIIGILGWALQMFLGLGFIRFLLHIVDGKKYELEDIFKGPQSVMHLVSFAVVTVLYGSIVGLGTLLFVVPGLIALVGLTFAQYIVAEQKAGIFESFQHSWSMTEGSRWKIFWLMIVIVLFNILGVLALGVGLLITIPVTYLISAHLYRTLGSKLVADMNEDSKETVIIEETIIIEETK